MVGNIICDMIKRNELDLADIGKERVPILLFYIVFSTVKLIINSSSNGVCITNKYL